MTLLTNDGAVLDRLVLVYADMITAYGLKRAFRLPPSEPLVDEDLPCVFSLVGPMLRPIPGTSSGQVLVPRTFVMRLLVAPSQAGGMDTADEGWQAMTEAVPWMGKVLQHFLNHPRLETDAAPAQAALAWMSEDLLVQDGGIGPKLGPGGADYVGIDFNLTITMRSLVSRIA